MVHREKGGKLEIPGWLLKGAGRETSPVYFLDLRESGLEAGGAAFHNRINEGLGEILRKMLPGKLEGTALIKIHPGEPKSRTRLSPAVIKSQAEFIRKSGVEPVTGDSTVIYTGGRGDRSNPTGDVSAYMAVVEANGWDRKNTGLDFVVIDRPVTSVPGVFEFGREEVVREVESPGCYAGVFVSGGFEAADLILNNAHLTMHGLSPVALCAKGISMGGASSRGKKQMHMNLAPRVDAEACRTCGLCIESCPYEALSPGEGDVPELTGERCVGCGECMAVCPAGAITMFHSGKVEWGKGTDSFVSRMTDFIMSMMNGKWGGLINIGHLYNITGQCDCMNTAQKPIVGDIGLIASRNPFACDNLAARLFLEQVRKEGKKYSLDDYPENFDYINRAYGVVTDPEIIKV